MEFVFQHFNNQYHLIFIFILYWFRTMEIELREEGKICFLAFFPIIYVFFLLFLLNIAMREKYHNKNLMLMKNLIKHNKKSIFLFVFIYFFPDWNIWTNLKLSKDLILSFSVAITFILQVSAAISALISSHFQ